MARRLVTSCGDHLPAIIECRKFGLLCGCIQLLGVRRSSSHHLGECHVPKKAKERLASLAEVREELERVKAQADDLIARVSADLARDEHERVTASSPTKKSRKSTT